MKRDMDVVREILCKIADAPGKPPSEALTEGKTPEEEATILHHIGMLHGAGLVTGIEAKFLSGTKWADLALTWQGEEVAEAARDPKVWGATKKAAGELRGFSLDLLKDLAKGFVRKQAERLTGVEL